MLGALQSIVDFFGTIFRLISSIFTSIFNAVQMLAAGISVPFEILPYLPSVFGAIIIVVMSVIVARILVELL